MGLTAQVLYEFDKFRLDPAEQLLLCDGKPVPLTPKAFQILCVLIRSKGRLLDKDDLIKRVWPNSFVEEANLSVNISALRKALGDTPNGQKFIGTVPKRGYRFLMPVHEVSESSQTETKAASLVEISEPTVQVPEITEPRISAGGGTGEPPEVITASESKPLASRVIRIVLPVAVVIAFLIYFVNRHQPLQNKGASEIRRLAILPFQNLNHDPNNDFLGFSLADAVITKLGYVRTLTVRPSSTIQKYRDQGIDVGRVAAELNVDTLLASTFIREGDDLRVTSQLIDVKTQEILWRDAFDLKYDRLRSVQDTVAQEIVKGLELNLTASEAEHLRPDATVNPAAYEYYLRGVDLYARGEFVSAIKMLEASTQIDPNYALTWAHLGRSYNATASFQLGGRDRYHKAQAAFEKALSLQPKQIETQIYMANLLTDTGRVEQAVPLLRDALRTNPNHADAHWELGYAYRFAGMIEQSIAECEKARALDPGVKLNTSALNGYLYLGQYDKFLESIPKDSSAAFNVFYRGFGEYYKSDFQEATLDFDRAFELEPSLFQAQIGKALSDGTRREYARGVEILRETERKIQDRGVGDPEASYKLAQAYAVLGDKPSALRVLERSIASGFFAYPYLTADPLLNSLRKEPQFANLLQAARQRHEAFQRTFF
jgi:DNA-binding winged helix-turn-helix (wHTH) protein/TolB-like protein